MVPYTDCERLLGCDDQLLQVLLATNEPLTVRQMSHVLGLADEYKLLDVLGPLSHVLNLSATRSGELCGDTQLTLYHKTLADWLTDPKRRLDSRDRPHYVDLKIGHRLMLTYCLQQISTKPTDAQLQQFSHLFIDYKPLLFNVEQVLVMGPGGMEHYAVSHVAHHAISAEEWDRATAVLCSLQYTELKLALQQRSRHIADLSSAIKQLQAAVKTAPNGTGC